ncbi:hypothetical protein [Adhaeribacter aquaticus]|uniref:hypothetical protein n=1 Tax=Adhaeribacter aquaticus TaxID=299567 RepID=UPI00041D5027|nr:hypothetical protein [Adhaeribacter aquaticus]
MEDQIISEIILEQVFENDFITILWAKDKSLFNLIWKRQITLTERKEGTLKAFSLTKELLIHYWLIDDLQLSYLSPEEKDWIIKEWIYLASTSPILKLGVVTTEYYPALLANTDFTQACKTLYQSISVIQHEVFIDYTTALNWLLPKPDEAYS